jgi:hypothetical protein
MTLPQFVALQQIQTKFTLAFKLSTLCALFGLGEYHNFCLAFWKVYFHRIKGKETLSRSHDLNTADDNTGLTESLSNQMSCIICVCVSEFKIVVIEISLDLK